MNANKPLLTDDVSNVDYVEAYGTVHMSMLYIEAHYGLMQCITRISPAIQGSTARFTDWFNTHEQEFLRMNLTKVNLSSLLVNFKCVSVDSKLNADILFKFNGMTL